MFFDTYCDGKNAARPFYRIQAERRGVVLATRDRLTITAARTVKGELRAKWRGAVVRILSSQGWTEVE